MVRAATERVLGTNTTTIGKGVISGRAPPLDEQLDGIRDNIDEQVRALFEYVQHLKTTPHYRQHTVPFHLQKRPSTAGLGSGTGVFLHGKAQPGAVVAFYPGTAYNVRVHHFLPNYPKVDRDNEYLMSRYDGVILDAKERHDDLQAAVPGGVRCADAPRDGARASAVASVAAAGGSGVDEHNDNDDDARRDRCAPASASLAAGAAETAASIPRDAASRGGERMHFDYGDGWAWINPYALAHYINHPPRDALPNVMPCQYDFDLRTLDESLWDAVPNRRFRVNRHNAGMLERLAAYLSEDAGDAPGRIPGLLMVATRVVENEELFLNYRLNPTSEQALPQWYWDPDPDASRRRWA